MADVWNCRGKYCLTGGPGLLSCSNSSQTPGVSMHLFPSNKVTPRKWTKFVQKHHPGFKPTRASVLCSIRIAPDSFARKIDCKNQQSVRRLEKEVFPTIDVAVQKGEDAPITEREQRTVSLVDYVEATWPGRCCLSYVRRPQQLWTLKLIQKPICLCFTTVHVWKFLFLCFYVSELFPPGKYQQLTAWPCISHWLANLLVSELYFAGSVQLKVFLVAFFFFNEDIHLIFKGHNCIVSKTVCTVNWYFYAKKFSENAPSLYLLGLNYLHVVIC